jgi:hypothetical protein
MLITAANLLVNGSTTPASSFETASVSLVQGRLNLLAVNSAYVGGVAAIPTVTGASQTWTQVVTQIDAANIRRVTIFRAFSPAAASGALTIDFGGQTQLSCYWSVDSFRDIVRTGTNGADAVVQSAGATVAGTTTGITVTLGAFESATNATYGAVRAGIDAGFAVGSGFSALTRFPATGNCMISTIWKNSADTSVDWAWSSAAPSVSSCAVEIHLSHVKNINDLETASIKAQYGLDRAYIKTRNGLG